MSNEITFKALRENLDAVLDQVVDEQEPVIVLRKGSRNVAIIPASELAGLIETAYLFRSPKNARRLMAAINRSPKHPPAYSSVEKLRQDLLGA